jgi:transaldolase
MINAQGYFRRVSAQTSTRFWINNPTVAEAGKAIDAGAVGCTCNPSYCQKMLDHPDRDELPRRLLEEAVAESKDDPDAEVILQRKLARPVVDLFRPLHDRNPLQDGFVTLQGDPTREHNPDAIVEEAIENHALGRNVCAKIPVTKAGLVAIERLVAENIPITGTEVFAVSQVAALCEAYERARRASGRNPVIFLAHIAGIFDDYLKAYVETHHVDISPDVLWQAGMAVARKVYHLMSERGYRPTLVCGGARGLHHFTEMVGGKLAVTINWLGTADKLIEQNPAVVARFFNPVSARVIDELLEKLPDFRRGYLNDGLAVDEFYSFGPVELFRGSFLKSWQRVLALVKEHRDRLRTEAPT